MNLETKKFKFEILTPCFSGTALGKFADNPEIRVPPIRGNIRLWHNILLGEDNVKRVWGLAEKENTYASKVSVKLIDTQCEIVEASILPHKKSGSPFAIKECSIVEFELVRLVGCTDIDWKNAEKATKLWLLLGGMGARANRAAGSVWPCDDWTPNDEDSFYNILKELGLKNYSLV
jgi:CRISPR type III-B/RAMP module RAMP protein Cmr1